MLLPSQKISGYYLSERINAITKINCFNMGAGSVVLEPEAIKSCDSSMGGYTCKISPHDEKI